MVEQTRNVSIAVGTSSVQVSPPLIRGQRIVFVATNTSTGGQIITLSWGGEAVAGAGVVLNAGSSWSESIEGTFTPNEQEIQAVASGAGGTLSVHERVKS